MLRRIDFWLWCLWCRAVGLLCLVRPHVWSDFGDEDPDGWFWDTGGRRLLLHPLLFAM